MHVAEAIVFVTVESYGFGIERISDFNMGGG